MPSDPIRPAASGGGFDLPPPAYRPVERRLSPVSLDTFRLGGFADLPERGKDGRDPRDERIKDVMHLAREFSRRTRRPGTQGHLTGQREKALRRLLANARSHPVNRITYKALRADAPCCCDVVRGAIHYAEVLNLIEVVRHRAPGAALPGANSYVVKPVPSRFSRLACEDWIAAKIAATEELQRAQDAAIAALGWMGALLQRLALRRLRRFTDWKDAHEARWRAKLQAGLCTPEEADKATRPHPVAPVTPSSALAARLAHAPPRRTSTEPAPPVVPRWVPPPLTAPPGPPPTFGTLGRGRTDFRSQIKNKDFNNYLEARPARRAFTAEEMRAWAEEFAAKLKKRRPPDG